mmetsp:Transcript_13827/g.58127  ORF Transcript_13827/g.58127 Transcript_13827/m.58127 type:complete len:209 (-) Transcript_13827:2798-3424(-)
MREHARVAVAAETRATRLVHRGGLGRVSARRRGAQRAHRRVHGRAHLAARGGSSREDLRQAVQPQFPVQPERPVRAGRALAREQAEVREPLEHTQLCPESADGARRPPHRDLRAARHRAGRRALLRLLLRKRQGARLGGIRRRVRLGGVEEKTRVRQRQRDEGEGVEEMGIRRGFDESVFPFAARVESRRRRPSRAFAPHRARIVSVV